MKNFIKIFLLLFLISCSGYLDAQSVRSLNNEGVDLYKEGKFADSEVNFKKGNLKEPKNFQTNFNLGDAFYKQGRYDDAIKSYRSALTESETPEQKAKVFHNIGNSLLKDKKIKPSIEAYTNSLKLNPKDEDTKYNLSYALSLLKNQNSSSRIKTIRIIKTRIKIRIRIKTRTRIKIKISRRTKIRIISRINRLITRVQNRII